jgi:hypothetical protein
MGSIPSWYAAVRASKYLGGGILPWEWDDAPLFWREAVLAAESAEATAQDTLNQHQR